MNPLAGYLPRQREIYLLHRGDGLTYQQIAEKLGIGRSR
ncbi:MAG: hypothetical protein IPM85_16985 [Chitinophagaceae bacterium]|nr:hypothetical protein [Chitinophagaceae bacterium]